MLYDPSKDKTKWCYGLSIEERLYYMTGKKGKLTDSQIADLEKRVVKKIDDLHHLKHSRKPLENPIKTNKLRRGRGYKLEYNLVKKVKQIDDSHYFDARRLGGTSTGFPDVVITLNNYKGGLVACECKSGKDTYILDIPEDEVYRCIDCLKFLGMYGDKTIAFVFRFMKSKKMKREKVVEAYWTFSMFDSFIIDERNNLMKVSCDSRTNQLTFWYADGTYCSLSPNRFNGYSKDFQTFISVIEESCMQ